MVSLVALEQGMDQEEREGRDDPGIQSMISWTPYGVEFYM